MKKSEMRSVLVKFYERKYPDYRVNSKAFSEFILSAIDLLNNEYKGKSLNVLTTTYNVQDGIGDYVNQIDLMSWLCSFFEEYKSFRIKGITFLELKKFKFAELLPPNIIKENGTKYLTNRNDLLVEHLIEGNIICDSAKSHQFIVHPSIKELLASIDFVINIPIYFSRDPSCLTELLMNFDKKSFIQSRGEYGLRGNEHQDQFKKRIYYEKCMGVNADEAGVKFYTDLQKLCSETDTISKKEKLLNELENLSLLKFLLIQGENEYFQHYGFGFGYIQDQSYSILFARLLIAKESHKKKGVTIIGDVAHFFDFNKINKNLIEQLILSEFGIIELRNNTGEIISKIELSKKPKLLTIIDFKGTTQHDKKIFIALSDMVAGSGNSSFSEMLSSKRFPFIQPIEHVRPFYHSFVQSIGSTKGNYSEELINYFQYNLNHKNWDIYSYAKQEEIKLADIEGNAIILIGVTEEKTVYFIKNHQLVLQNNIPLTLKINTNEYKYLFRGAQESGKLDPTLLISMISELLKLVDLPSPESDENKIKILIKLVSDKQSVAKLMHAWCNHCDFLDINRNAYDDFIEIVSAFVIFKILEKNQADMSFIVKILPDGCIGGTTLLHMAIQRGLMVCVENILACKEINLINKPCLYKNFTPIFLAVKHQQYDIVELLIEHGAYLELRDSDDKTILHHSFEQNDKKLLSIFLRKCPILFYNLTDADRIDFVTNILANKIDDSDLNIIINLLGKDDHWKNIELGQDYKLLYEIILKLPYHMQLPLNIQEYDILDAARYAINNDFTILFRNSCDLCLHMNSDCKETLMGFALAKIDNIEFLEIYINIFKVPADFVAFYKNFLPATLGVEIKKLFDNLTSDNVNQMIELQLQLISFSKRIPDIIHGILQNYLTMKISMPKKSFLTTILQQLSTKNTTIKDVNYLLEQLKNCKFPDEIENQILHPKIDADINKFIRDQLINHFLTSINMQEYKPTISNKNF